MVEQNAKLSSERALVTTYITKNPKIFKIFSYENQEDLSDHRWTVDEQNDLEFIRKIYSIMKPKTNFSMNEIIEILVKNPELLKINSGIMRNEGHLKLYDNDKVVK
jgi:spore coat polysaccharide biosynthesis protein SpsF